MKNIMKRISAVFMALCMCFSVFAISSFAFGFNNTNSTDGLDRNATDIQPMTFDYVRKNINTMVQGMTNKYVLKDSSNVDLSRDVYIVDPRIVNVRVDTSDVDWNTYGAYPIHYTVCFKPSVQDEYKTAKLTYKDAEAYDKDAKLGGVTIPTSDGFLPDCHITRSPCYVYTDCASKLSNNEYVTLTFTANVEVGAPSYLDDFVKQAVPVYQSNTQMYSSSQKPEVPTKYYKNIQGTFQYCAYHVTEPFNLVTGESGNFCNYCGKTFPVTGAHNYGSAQYSKDAAFVHDCDDGHNHGWTSYSGREQTFNKGESFQVEIFIAS